MEEGMYVMTGDPHLNTSAEASHTTARDGAFERDKAKAESTGLL